MTTASTWKEREELRHKLENVKAGDKVVVEVSGRKSTTVKLVEVEKVTAKQLVADGRRFWKSGNNSGQEIGQASRGWRQSFMSSSAWVRVVKDAADMASVKKAMAERAAAREKANDKADKERDTKHARRATRYEGLLDRYAKHVLSHVVEDGDEKLNDVAKHVGYSLEQCVRDLEHNEEAIRSSVASTERHLEEIIDRLDNDMHISLWSSDYREKVGEREAIIEKAKEMMYLAKKMFGRLDDDAWKYGFKQWVEHYERPDDKLQAEGWDAAAAKNESGGNRPTLSDADELNPYI